jgi:hypothetical protein
MKLRVPFPLHVFVSVFGHLLTNEFRNASSSFVDVVLHETKIRE